MKTLEELKIGYLQSPHYKNLSMLLIPGWGRTADKIVDITGTTSDWYNTVELPVQWIKSVED